MLLHFVTAKSEAIHIASNELKIVFHLNILAKVKHKLIATISKFRLICKFWRLPKNNIHIKAYQSTDQG